MLKSIFLLSLVVSASNASSTRIVERTEGGSLFVKDPSSSIVTQIKTQLADLKEVGVLKRDGKPSYLIVSGRSCSMTDRTRESAQECAQKDPGQIQTGIFLISLSTQRVHNFIFPGKIVDSKAGRTVHDSRAFYGDCVKLDSHLGPDAYVVFQREVIDRKKSPQPSVFIAAPGKDLLSEKLLENRLPNIKYTLQSVKAGKCWEISGRNRMMSAESIKSIIRLDHEAADDNDDPPTKENQTSEELPALQE